MHDRSNDPLEHKILLWAMNACYSTTIRWTSFWPLREQGTGRYLRPVFTYP